MSVKIPNISYHTVQSPQKGLPPSIYIPDMSFFLSDKIQEAIEFLRQHEPPEGYDVKFSGGKDSIVMYDMVKKSGVKHTVYYNMTTIDPPEVMKFIKKHYPEVIWLRPKRSFFDHVLTKGLPTKVKRWCCEKLKHKVHAKEASRHKIVGIRAEESKKRAQRGRISTFGKETMYSPILYFTEGDVWDYIESEKLQYPSLYDEGFSRLGCVICPFICRSGGILEMHMRKWPHMYRRFERVVAEYYEKKRDFFISRGIDSPAQLLDLWYTSRPIPVDSKKQKQMSLLK